MEHVNTNWSREEYESILKGIRGIKAVRVVLGDQGIEEVHILATGDRNPKQIVRDIESAILAGCGIAVDHKKISVAQVSDRGPAASTCRPRLVSVVCTSSTGNIQVQVELEYGATIYRGQTEGPSVSFNKQRLAAEATLKAVEQIINQHCVFLLEDVTINQTGRWEAVLVVVTAVADGMEERLVGAALVGTDQLEAVIKAVLAAINRRLGVLAS